MKQSLLESFGFSAPDKFPVFADRFPIQLLSYLRLTRIQDPLLFTKVGQQTCTAAAHTADDSPYAGRCQAVPYGVLWCLWLQNICENISARSRITQCEINLAPPHLMPPLARVCR